MPSFIPDIKTDPRLVTLMKSGDNFLRLVDPDGLLGRGTVCDFMYSGAAADGARQWRVWVVFPSGERVSLSGVFADGAVRIVSVRMPASPGDAAGKWKDLPVRAGRTLSLALGELAGVDIRLKRCLSLDGSAPAAGKGADPVKEVQSIFRYVEDALFWDVHGGLRKDGYRDRFVEFCVSYRRNESGTLSRVVMKASAPVEEGKVVVGASADFFGLGDKEVILKRNLGMGRRMRAVCEVEVGGRGVPSVATAFDLDSRVPVFYCKNRKKKTSMGKPVVKQ